jgi:hypothetical protein
MKALARWLLTRRLMLAGGLFAMLALTALRAWAQENPSVEQTLADHKMLLDTIWVMVAAFLVFWMQAGICIPRGRTHPRQEHQ